METLFKIFSGIVGIWVLLIWGAAILFGFSYPFYWLVHHNHDILAFVYGISFVGALFGISVDY